MTLVINMSFHRRNTLRFNFYRVHGRERCIVPSYLVQHSAETTYYTVNDNCRCRPANSGFTRDLVLPQQWRCAVQHSGVLLNVRVEGLESTNLWENINVFLCCISSARKQPMYLLIVPVVTIHLEYTM